MIFLFLDVLLSFFSDIPTFFVLISILCYPKNKFFLFLLIPLVLDLLITHTYFLNTFLFVLIFFIVKHLKVTKRNLENFLLLINLVYFLYVFSLGFIKGFSFFYLLQFSFSNYFINLIFYLLCYKLCYPYIKLSR